MFGPIISVVVAILIAGVIVWGIDHLPAINDMFKQVARIIIIVVVAIWAILVIASMFGVGPALHWR